MDGGRQPVRDDAFWRPAQTQRALQSVFIATNATENPITKVLVNLE